MASMRPMPRGSERCEDAPVARCISPLAVDGATAFCIDVQPSTFRDATGSIRTPAREFVRLVDLLRRERSPTVDAEERREGVFVELPMPDRGLRPDLGFESGEVGAANGPDPWRHHWGPVVPPPVCRVTVDGVHRQSLTFYAEDRCFTRLREGIDHETGEVTWQVRCEAKARELMADGPAVWVERWLGLWSWLLTGVWATPRECRALGWRTTALHINSDFVGMDFSGSEVANFLRGLSYSRWGDVKRLHPVGEYSDLGRSRFPFAETLQIGRRNSDALLVMYRKGDQLRNEKRVKPEASMYAPTWQGYGWNPSTDGDPFRVEFRLRKKALDIEVDGQALDLRDPAVVCDPSARALVWGGLAWNRRLVLPDNPKVERRTTDPRWQAVLDVCPRDVRTLRQASRQVREMTQAERVARSTREAALAVVKWAACRGAVAIPDWRALGDAMRVLGDTLQSGGEPTVMGVLPASLDLRSATRRAAAAAEFFEPEALDGFEDLAERMDDARGLAVPRVDCFTVLREDARDVARELKRREAELRAKGFPPSRRGRKNAGKQ